MYKLYETRSQMLYITIIHGHLTPFYTLKTIKNSVLTVAAHTVKLLKTQPES